MMMTMLMIRVVVMRRLINQISKGPVKTLIPVAKCDTYVSALSIQLNSSALYIWMINVIFRLFLVR